MGSELLLTLLLAAFSASAKPPRVPGGSPVLLSKRAATRLLIHQVMPKYPSVAKINYIQGPVDLQVVVTPQGKVGAVHVLRGEALLAAAALKAVKRWHYRPYIGTHGPVGFETRVRVKFALRVWKLAKLPSHPAKFLARQVRPPRVVRAPEAGLKAHWVRMRVLVGEKGNVLDAEPLGKGNDDVGLVHSWHRNWRFLPARWGNLAVPWYLDVKVPVSQSAGETPPNSSAR